MEVDEDSNDELIERQYQTVLAEQAFSSNRILFLPTGSGKTFIAISVLRRMFHLLEPAFLEGGKRAVFLVNTVALVEQQARVLERHLLLDGVGMYSGDMNVDFWNMKMWIEEFCKYQVMVMTAEILNQLLLKKFISLSNLALVILDECHHAVEDHPMRQIMRLFEDCPEELQPRVIGLTATLLNGTPKSIPKVDYQVKTLEVTLHSTVATVDSWDLVRQFSTHPVEKFFTFGETVNNDLCNYIDHKIVEVQMMCKAFTFVTDDTCEVRRVDGFVPMKTGKKNDLGNLMVQVTKQLGWLGPYGCFKTLQAIYVTLKIVRQKMSNRESNQMIDTLVCLLVSLSHYLESFMLRRQDSEDQRAVYFSSHKVKVLLKLIENHYNQCMSKQEDDREPMQTLIFVEEKMTAKILCSILKNIARSERYAFIKAAFIVGGSYNPFNETWEGTFNRNINDKIVERFRQKEINVLVATDVLEEGIDIPSCNLVVRFDEAKSFRSYVQSKGRARHNSSLFCLMARDSDLSSYCNKIMYFQQIGERLEELLIGRTDYRPVPSDNELEALYESEVEPYFTPVGSKVTMTSSISLVNGYCLHLAHDRFCKVSPNWHKKNIAGQGIVVAMQLPRLSPLQEFIQGIPMPTLKLAKRAAALEVCKRLHEVGELDDFLKPSEKCLEEKDMTELLPLWDKEDSVTASEPKTGTSKRVRAYPQMVPNCLQDCTPVLNKKVYLHHIEIYPDYDAPSFADSKKFAVFSALKEKRNFAIISSKTLPEVCPFPVFSKFGSLTVKVVSSGRPIDLTEEQFMDVTVFHWNLFTGMIPVAKKFVSYSKDSYLLAATKQGAQGVIDLDWVAMRECCAAYHGKDIPLHCVIRPTHRTSELHEVYFVTQVCKELDALSSFPNKEFASYYGYYQVRHKCKLLQPKSPLVEVQPFQKVNNNLVPRSKNTKGNETDSIHFPLEVCKVICRDGCLYLKASLLPSVLHRLHRYLLADQLCRIIRAQKYGGNINLPHDCSLHKPPGEKWEKDVGAKAPSKTPNFAFKEPINHTVKRKLASMSYGAMLEPVDIEHEFETVTAGDIETYGKFARMKITAANSPFRASNKTHYAIKLPVLRDKEGRINILKNRTRVPYPCHILEATTAASADDIVNLERLETLGDSFLKFAVSFVLFTRFPELSEGKLTQVKGQILGNRNLFYCAHAKDLGYYLQVRKMVPSEQWIPPSFSIPQEIAKNKLYNVTRHLNLTEEEQFENFVKKSTLDELKVLSLKYLSLSGESQLKSDSSIKSQDIPDKSVADCVEALIGVFLQASGPEATMLFLEYMRVLPQDSKNLLLLPSHRQPGGKYSDPALKGTVLKISNIMGYSFENFSLLTEALTHASSTSSTCTYERLEFVGDAVLDFLITAHIYEHCGKLTPGELTDLRSALVNNITFACLSVRLGLYKLMNQGSIALMESMDRFVRFQEARDHVIDEEILILLEEKECKIAETVDVPKALGDIFEAVIGAIFLDCGKNFSTVWKVIYRLMKNEISLFSKKVPKQVVRCLYEAVGEHHLTFRISESTKEMSLADQVHGVLTVQIGEETRLFHGFGVNKTAAKKSAAKLALRELTWD